MMMRCFLNNLDEFLCLDEVDTRFRCVLRNCVKKMMVYHSNSSDSITLGISQLESVQGVLNELA
jgi:hypothetical protein